MMYHDVNDAVVVTALFASGRTSACFCCRLEFSSFRARRTANTVFSKEVGQLH